MVSISNSPEEQFEQQAANDWQLKRLYKDLADAKRQVAPHKRKGLTAVEKQHLCGLLCGYSPAEIAEKLFKRPRGVEVDLCNTVYRYVEQLTTRLPNTVRNWRDIPEWLEAAEYKHQASETSDVEAAIAHPHQDGEDLMPVATKMLERFGFEREFNLSSSSIHIRYQLKIPKNGSNLYQLVLVQRKEGLSIYIPKNLLEKTLLYLMYYVNYDEFEVAHSVAGIFWVLPSKKEIFLESLHRNYWSVIKGQTEGSFYLNDVDDDGYGCGPVIPSRLLDEFSPNTLSNTNSYLVLSDDQRFPGTWQVCICSLEVLEEFIGHFGEKILMAN